MSGRTVRRDIDRLRELGYPVESLTGPTGGYRLAAGTAMPPLLLDDEEAIAIAVGLRTAARTSVTGIEETSVRALVKLEQVLPSHLRRRVQALSSATMTLERGGGPTADPQVLTLIAAACRDHERVRFGYRPATARARAARSSRTRSSTSAAAGTSSRGTAGATTGARSASTASRARPPGARFRPRELPAKDGAAYVAQSLSARPEPLRGAAHAARLSGGDAQADAAVRGPFEPIGEDRCEYRTGDDNLDWLAARIAMLGVEFEVHEPPELVEHLQALAGRLSRATA